MALFPPSSKIVFPRRLDMSEATAFPMGTEPVADTMATFFEAVSASPSS